MFESKSQISRFFTMMVILAIIINVVILIPNVSARYLPTRSNDQVRRQEIKEILRLVS